MDKDERAARAGSALREGASALERMRAAVTPGGHSDTVLERICRINLRIASVIAPVMGVASLVVAAFFAMTVPAVGHELAGALGLFIGLAHLVFIVACVCLCAQAKRLRRQRSLDRHAVYRWLSFFMIAGYLYALFAAAVSYRAFGQMGIFYVFLIINAVLFIIAPAIQVALSFGAMCCFFALFALLGLVEGVMFVNCAVITVAVAFIGVIRYGSQAAAVASGLDAERASRTDVLTGLSNRAAFTAEVASFIGRDTTMAITDVDDFKYFNDAYSHQLGDRVLKGFARALRRGFPDARIYRYGGDEFVVMMTDVSMARFDALARSFIASLADISLSDDAADLSSTERVSASMGYAKGEPRSDEELQNLFHAADNKLYEAKRDGKHQAIGTALDGSALAAEGKPESDLPFLRAFELDTLTGIPNMQYFRAHGLQFAEHLAAMGRQPVVVYFNLANFKLVNERQGYPAGDRFLCTTAQALQQAFPRMFAARIAEDRFALICVKEGLDRGFAELQAAVEAQKKEPSVQLKAGAYVIEGALNDIGDAYDAAKTACDSIKNVHGQFLRFYDGKLDQNVKRRRYVFENIEPAIRKGEIEVHYQPIYRATTGKVCASEALVRWRDERYGLIPPGEFIGLLEKAQQINELDSYVVRRVCDDWRELRDAGLPAPPVSVNFSRIDFQLGDVVALIEANTARVSMPRNMLRVEVTESAFTRDADRLAAQIKRLRELGYQVWLDDFGSGYSSLAQLEWHDFNVAKIDMAFLKNFEDAQVRKMLTSVVDMIKRLGVQTLIEGVETEAQLSFMREIGCELIQGFYLARPMEAARYKKLVRERAEKVEPAEHNGYYDAIGRINPLSQNPFAFGDAPATDDGAPRGTIALAVVEYAAGTVSFITANAAHDELLARMGYAGGRDKWEARLASVLAQPGSDLGTFLDAVCGAPGVLAADFMVNGDDCLLHARKIASHGPVHAVLVSMENRSLSQEHTVKDLFNAALEYLYAIYDRVEAVERTTRRVTVLYTRAAGVLEAFNDASENHVFSEERKRALDALVHPDDRARFRAFFDDATLDARFAGTELTYLSGAFRMLSEDGSYAWRVIVLVPMELHGASYVLVCQRGVYFDLIEEFTGKQGGVDENLLWSTALELLPEKIFWKDADRRFLGANRAFLDYYGFSSVREIFGKTDEDMNWHTDPEKFRQDELAVLGGAKTKRTDSTCIARGRLRHIVARKMRLERNGDAKGLIGYFVDVEEEMGRRGHVVEERLRDGVTGLLSSMGAMSALADVEDAFHTEGTDYGLVYLDIDNLRELNRQYSRAFGDRVLASVGEALTRAAGTEAVAARLRADEFVLVAQLADGTEAQRFAVVRELAEHAEACIGSIVAVDAQPCHISASLGYALRSRTDGPAEALQLAERRMREERSVRATQESGTRAPLKFTAADLRRHMTLLAEHFDGVRLVDPSRCRAFELNDKGKLGECYTCYQTWERKSRCVECISALAAGDGRVHRKYARTDRGTELVQAHAVDVDGKLYVIELGTLLWAFPDTGRVRTARELDELLASEIEATEHNPAYFDQATGAFSRRYFDTMLAHLRGSVVAVVAFSPASAGALPGQEQSDAAARRVLKAVESHTRTSDTVVRASAGAFLVSFDSESHRFDLEARMRQIRNAAVAALAGEDGRPAAKVSLGAVKGAGTLGSLADEAERACYRAKAGSGLCVVNEYE